MLKSLVDDVVASILPGRCVGCGARAEAVCASCAAGLRPAFVTPPPPGVDAWVAPFAYEGVVRELVARLKYRNLRSALPWLAGAAAGAARPLAAGRGAPAPHVATWAPTTAARRRERGFDHAELLARAIGRDVGLPVRSVLARLDRTSQTGRAAPERLCGPRFAASDTSLHGCVLLVDDVATTGATLSAAARSIRMAGADAVVAVTVARTPKPSR